MNDTALVVRLREVFEGGAGAFQGALRFLPLVTLESGARIALDPDAHWVLVPGDGRPACVYSDEAAHLMHEVIEEKRERFDDALEKKARASGLPPDDVVMGFPAVPVVRSILAKKSSYLTRLALEWVLPSERRELREEILEVTRTDNMPAQVKELARRLLVRE